MAEPFQNDIRRGLGRPKTVLLKHEIEAAQSISLSEADAQRKLGVSKHTYEKYAKLYGIYGRVMDNKDRKTPRLRFDEEKSLYPLSRIFANEYPNYTKPQLKKRCIRAKKLAEKCNNCGYCERRLGDNKIPLVLNFKDGNEKNMALENLEILCYNCFFVNVNNPIGRKKKFKIESL
jgi:ferredoxin